MMKKKSRIGFILLLITGAVLFFTLGCKRDKDDTKNVLGFEFLKKIPGLWHGPVTSSTSAGSFDIWYVDFRPVSAGQVSQFS